jgi:hypothetical protein
VTHSHKWIGSVVKNLRECADEKTCVRVLEGCGRACITQSLLKRARKCRKESSDVDGFLTSLGHIWSHLHREGEKLYVTYPRCYCPIARAHKMQMPKLWCNCSRGWIKELFETSLGKPVRVELKKSIIRGDDECRFQVWL